MPMLAKHAPTMEKYQVQVGVLSFGNCCLKKPNVREVDFASESGG